MGRTGGGPNRRAWFPLRSIFQERSHQPLEIRRAGERQFLRLLMAGIGAGEAGAEIRHHGDGQAFQADEPRQNDFRDRRHADEIRAEELRGPNFGRRLEGRAGEPHIDAFMQVDPRLPRGAAEAIA